MMGNEIRNQNISRYDMIIIFQRIIIHLVFRLIFNTWCNCICFNYYDFFYDWDNIFSLCRWWKYKITINRDISRSRNTNNLPVITICNIQIATAAIGCAVMNTLVFLVWTMTAIKIDCILNVQLILYIICVTKRQLVTDNVKHVHVKTNITTTQKNKTKQNKKVQLLRMCELVSVCLCCIFYQLTVWKKNKIREKMQKKKKNKNNDWSCKWTYKFTCPFTWFFFLFSRK